jgi:hypothetical protein
MMPLQLQGYVQLREMRLWFHTDYQQRLKLAVLLLFITYFHKKKKCVLSLWVHALNIDRLK